MSDLRKPFYDYALANRQAIESDTGQAAWVFAEWAVEYMYDYPPERAFEAYVGAQRSLKL